MQTNHDYAFSPLNDTCTNASAYWTPIARLLLSLIITYTKYKLLSEHTCSQSKRRWRELIWLSTTNQKLQQTIQCLITLNAAMCLDINLKQGKCETRKPKGLKNFWKSNILDRCRGKDMRSETWSESQSMWRTRYFAVILHRKGILSKNSFFFSFRKTWN